MDTAQRIARTIAAEIGARPEQVTAAVGLLDEGATVPFVARYRKEVTGGLDDTQLRKLDERLVYMREMEARRAAIASSERSSASAGFRSGKIDTRRLSGQSAPARSGTMRTLFIVTTASSEAA